MVKCAEAVAYKVESACSGVFVAPAHATFGEIKPVAGRPYASQKARYRLFTDRKVQLGDKINGGTVISKSVPCEGRAFCDVIHFDVMNPEKVELYELTRIEGADARTVPQRRGTAIAGVRHVSSTTRIEDERKVESGSVLFVLCPEYCIVPDRWIIRHDDCDYKVIRIDDVDAIDRLPLYVCRPERLRR